MQLLLLQRTERVHASFSYLFNMYSGTYGVTLYVYWPVLEKLNCFTLLVWSYFKNQVALIINENDKKKSMTHFSYECWYGLISTWFINMTGQKHSNSLSAVCCEAATRDILNSTASCPWPPRITSTSQLLKLFLLISHFQIRILIHTMKN